MKEYPYWWDTLPSAESQKLEVKSQESRDANLPARADVVIVGAGYTGLAAARQLAKVGAVRKGRPVKVLGEGELAGVSLQVSAHAFSASAREKIVAAGGSVTTLPTRGQNAKVS